MGTYYLRTFGCQMNEHDAERMRAVLEGEGLERVARPDDADVIVYNTCTVRQSADERFAGHVSVAARLKREDPSRIVVVGGCLPQAEGEGFFERFPFVDVALGPQNLHRLAAELRRRLACGDDGDDGEDGEEEKPGNRRSRSRAAPAGFFDDGPELSAGLPARRQRPFQAWVQVMSGCTNFCSYCIVPYVRGPERSRPQTDVLAEVRELVADGVREVTLLGQNVNAYGNDLPAPGRPTFAGLLGALDELARDREPGLARVRFMTSHPKDLTDEMIAAVADLRTVCEHVHLPAQAGSDRVLAAMNRGYTAASFLERVAALRTAVPEVSITTDLIAGFPGETEDDFAATLALVKDAAFDAAFTFIFSPRAGTAAAALPQQVDEETKRERVQQLVELTQAQSAQRRQDLCGRTFDVLVEGPARQPGRLRGRTRQNITVNLAGQAEPGKIVSVLVTRATSTTLQGHVVTG